MLLLLGLFFLTLEGLFAPASGGGVYNDYSLKDIPRLDQSPVKILISSLPTEALTEANSTDSSHYLPPYEFPYANATGNLTDPLLNSTGKNFEEKAAKPTDSEVEELLNVPTAGPQDLAPNPPHIIYNDANQVDDEVEEIDEEGNTEEDIRAEQPKGDDREQGIALVQGQMAAILAGIFVAVAVIGYVGLMTWRRYLENRYSGREMLVNEFEYNARDENLKYFSI